MIAKVYNDKGKVINLSVGGAGLLTIKTKSGHIVKYLGVAYESPMNEKEITEMWNETN